MSLIGFHRVLIAVGILFCAGYALWELMGFLENRNTGSLLLVLAFSAGALGLGYYLRHLTRILRLGGDSSRSSGRARR